MIKYVGPVVIYQIIDPDNYLLMNLDGKIFRVLKLANIRTTKGNVQNLAQLKHTINMRTQSLNT